ncbi:MAG: Asp23/Gls24 family envelope stress response protein [Firmicutes bacterium]|uniref:Asp23/Gls24 family envelope stress response protein n=1 Tax=Candidatus Gallilactobacillus intestinavium TaxID=2840838 RepID=A0A9D9H5K7_9LACO|nr:Asp23/Gls24 family envelope stress response protein [Candidatus Gallilactobacillus intestinavium]
MAAENNIRLNENDNQLGIIEITPEVLKIIVSLATVQVKGVKQMQGTLANSVSEFFGKLEKGKGVNVSVQDNQVTADVFVYLEYGVNVPKVANDIQKNIEQQVSLMTDLSIKEVNIHIVGMMSEKNNSGIDPDDIFGDNSSNKTKRSLHLKTEKHKDGDN